MFSKGFHDCCVSSPLHKIGLEEILFPAQPDNGIRKEDDIASL